MKRKIFSILFALVLAVGLSLIPAVPAAAQAPDEVWVDDSFPSDNVTHFQTIQAGITAVAPGGTVNVAVGTYAEDLLIPVGKDNLELAGATGATIKGVDIGAAFENFDILIKASGVKIHGFTIQGPDPVSGERTGGMVIGTPDVEIYENHFEVTNGSSWEGSDPLGELSQAIQTWCKTMDPQVTGLPYIDVDGLSIHGNTFTDHGTGTMGYEGIYINSDVGTESISIAANQFTGDIFRAITVERSKATISGNTIITDLSPGVVWNVDFGGWTGININDAVAEAQDAVTVIGNTIKGSGTGKGFREGIRIGRAGQTLTNISVTQNTVQMNTKGIKLWGSGADGVVVNYNNIDGNLSWGVENTDDASLLDATNNWWGDASGSYLVSGVGDKISPYVNASVWLDAAYPGGETTGLKVGGSYNLYLTGLGDSAVVYLDDIGNDALAPDDPDSPGSDSLYVVPDAFQYTTSVQGTKIISGVSPQYGTYTGGGGEDDEYIGIALTGPDELWMLEVLPADVVTITSDVSSFTYSTGTTFTATVEKSGEPLLTTVEVHLDNTGEAVVDGGFITEGSTDSSGEVEFTLTDEDIAAAGSLVLYVLGGDVGGLLGSPTVTDGVDDVAPAKLALTIGPLEIDVATQPSQLFADFPTPVTVTVTYDGVAFAGAKVSYEGAGIEGTFADTDGNGQSTTELTPIEIGDINVTVSTDNQSAIPPVNEYLGTATIAVVLAEDLNVTVAEAWVIAANLEGGNLDVTIQGSDANGPDGSGDNELDYVDIVVTGPNVNYSLAKAYWTGAAWGLFDESDLPTGVSGVASDTIRFVIAPNMANEDVDVEVTGYTYADTTFTEVDAATETVTVLGYALYNYPTEDIEIDQTAGLSLDVKTKDGQVVNSAMVTIVANADNAFGKDFNDSGEIEAGEKFAEITIGDNLITYVDTVETEVYYVNNGHYEVTDITFLALAAVSIDVRDAETPTIAAFVDPAFSIIIIGADVYTLTFDPVKLTAGVDAANVLKITITDNSLDDAPVTDVASITINGDVATFSGPVDNVYTVTASLLRTEEDTLDVTASNEGVSKYGTATLEVGLPSVERTFTETGKTTERNVMLTGEPYTVSVNVTDALGGALDGYLWIGTPLPTFLAVTTTPVSPIELADGIGEFDVTHSAIGTLVWKVGSGDNPDNAALVLEPSIAVQALSLILDWDPEAPEVGEEITFYVTNNYDEPAASIDIKIVSPGGDLTLKVTTLEGAFTHIATDDGNYAVYVMGDEDWQAPEIVTVVVTRLVSITAPESVSLYVGETEQLTIMATYDDGSELDVTADADAIYATDDDSVATVSTGGLITAEAAGEATITVTYTEGVIDVTTNVPVTVSEVPVLVSIAASPLSVILNLGETEQLTITATYSDGTADVTADATYESDNVSVATVDAGLITAVAEGTAIITVTYIDEITVTTGVSVTVTEVVPVTWSCPLDHEALIAPYPLMGRPFLSTGADLSEVSSDDWFQVLWLDESTGVWKSFFSEFAENTLLTLELDQYYYVIVPAPCDLTIPQ